MAQTESTNLEFKIKIDGVEQSVNSIDKLKEHAITLRKEFETTTDPKRFNQLQTELTKTNTILNTMNQTIEGADPQKLAASFFKLAEGVNGAFQISKIAGFGDKTVEVEKAIMQILSLRAIAEGILEGAIAAKNIQQTIANVSTSLNTAAESKNIIVKGLATAAQWALNKAVSANPYVLAATAIIAMGSALYYFIGGSEEAKKKQDDFNIATMRSVVASNIQAKNDKENIKLQAQANLISAKRILTYQDEIDLLSIKTLQQQDALKTAEDLASQEVQNIDNDLRAAMMRKAAQTDIDALQAKKVESLLKEKKASEDLHNFLLYKETNVGAEIAKIKRKYIDLNIDREFKYRARKISLMNDGIEKEKALAKLEYDQSIESAKRAGESKVNLYKLYQKKLEEIKLKKIQKDLEFDRKYSESKAAIQDEEDVKLKQKEDKVFEDEEKQKEDKVKADNKARKELFDNLNDTSLSYKKMHKEINNAYENGLITKQQYQDESAKLLQLQLQDYGLLVGAVNNAFGAIMQNLDQSSDAYKVFALGQIVANQGIATANAAAAAFSPANIENILSGGTAGLIKMGIFVANLTATFGQIYSTVSKFEDGGMVNGASHKNGGVKYAVGGTVAELEGGEAILNKRAMAQPVLRDIAGIINSVGGGVNFGNTKTNTSNNPQRVVLVYQDVKDMINKVNIVESNSKFRM